MKFKSKSEIEIGTEAERERSPIPPALRMMVFARDNFTCQYCGSRAPYVELHIDHIKPFSRGGNDMPSNLVTACVECNLGKSNTFYVPRKLSLIRNVIRFFRKRIVLMDKDDYITFRLFRAGLIGYPEETQATQYYYDDFDEDETELEESSDEYDGSDNKTTDLVLYENKAQVRAAKKPPIIGIVGVILIMISIVAAIYKYGYR